MKRCLKLLILLACLSFLITSLLPMNAVGSFHADGSWPDWASVAWRDYQRGGVNPTTGPSQTYTTTDWVNWGATAWHYYDPGVGVNAQTGLHRATLSWGCFTDWDLAAYIYSIIYARRLNLISDSGSWQFGDRIDKVLTFLEQRPLNKTDLDTPFWSYQWDAMNPFKDCGGGVTNPADSGRLLAALYALKVYSPTYTSRVNAIYARTKGIYDAMATRLARDYYAYLAAEGFAAFGADESAIFNVIDNYPATGDFVSTGLYGQSLPTMDTLSEPFMIAILEADSLWHAPTSRFLDFAKRAYLAQSGRFSDTNKLTAWSEGNSPSSLARFGYIYEYIICVRGCTPPVTWIVGGSTTPLAFTKVAFAYLAIYGETPYTLALVNVAKNLLATAPYSGKGFGEATLENGGDPGYPTARGASDKTNELVLAAAYRALSSYTTTVSTTTATTPVPEFPLVVIAFVLSVSLAAILLASVRKHRAPTSGRQ